MIALFLPGILLFFSTLTILTVQPYPQLFVRRRSSSRWDSSPPSLKLGSEIPLLIEQRMRQSLPPTTPPASPLEEILLLAHQVRTSFRFHAYGPADFHAIPQFFSWNQFLPVMEKKTDLEINCGTYSHIFIQALRAKGRAARLVILAKEKFQATHLLTEVWLEEEKCWILIDLLYDAIFTDEHGHALSARSVYKRCRSKQPVIPVQRFGNPDEFSTTSRLSTYLHEEGLASHLLTLTPRLGTRAPLIHPAFIPNETVELKWWKRQTAAQLGFMISIVLLVLSFLFPLPTL